MKRRQFLLQFKKTFDTEGETLMKEKQSNLMKEIA